MGGMEVAVRVETLEAAGDLLCAVPGGLPLVRRPLMVSERHGDVKSVMTGRALGGLMAAARGEDGRLGRVGEAVGRSRETVCYRLIEADGDFRRPE